MKKREIYQRLRDKGFFFREIGAIFGVTPQAVEVSLNGRLRQKYTRFMSPSGHWRAYRRHHVAIKYSGKHNPKWACYYCN